MAPLYDIKRINESKSYTNFGSFTLSIALHSSWSFPTAPILSAKLSIYYLRVVLRILKCYLRTLESVFLKVCSVTQPAMLPLKLSKKTLLIAHKSLFQNY